MNDMTAFQGQAAMLVGDEEQSLNPRDPSRPLVRLGFLFGIVLPLISALVYHTYAHMVFPLAFEWTRLVELPFILAEIGVIMWARDRGFDDMDYWRRAGLDLRAAFVLFVVGLFASSVFLTNWLLHSLALSLFTIIHLRFALAVHHLGSSSSRGDLTGGAFWICVGLVALTLGTAIKFAFPLPEARPGEMVALIHSLPGFISVRHFGSWFGCIAAALAVAVLFSRERRIGWVDVAFALALAVTIWSGTRAAVLALAAVCVWVVLTTKGWPSLRALAKFTLLCAIAGAFAYALVPDEQNFWLFATKADGASGDVSAGRLEMWRQGLAAWWQSPLFGWGSGSTMWTLDVGWTHTQPHNALVQFLLSWGLVGTVGACYLMARALWTAHFNAIHGDTTRPVLAMVYALLVMSLFSGTLYYPRFILMVVGGLAILVALGRSSKPARTA